MPQEPTSRYDIRQDLDGSWCVIDIFTGMVADYNGVPLKLRSEADARKMCTVVNALDKHRRRSW